MAYKPLENDDPLLEKCDSDEETWQQNHNRASPTGLWRLHVVAGGFWLLAFVFLFGASVVNREHDSNPDSVNPLFGTLSYSLHHFTSGMSNDRSVYQGHPSEENEAAWNHLTNAGIVALSPNEQATMPEKSAVFNVSSTGETTYIGAVEVFHQLHCLDMLRREIYGELDKFLLEHHSKKDKMEHLDHCVDFLRQSLMCRPSIEVLPFEVDDDGAFRARFDGLHTCADFEKVRDWAVARQAGDLTPQ